jgi:hypothetical protein
MGHTWYPIPQPISLLLPRPTIHGSVYIGLPGRPGDRGLGVLSNTGDVALVPRHWSLQKTCKLVLVSFFNIKKLT